MAHPHPLDAGSSVIIHRRCRARDLPSPERGKHGSAFDVASVMTS